MSTHDATTYVHLLDLFHCCTVWSKNTVNAAAECVWTERQGSSIWEVARRTLVTVFDKFQLVRCSQSVVSYGWEKVCFKVCCKSWITNNINMKFCFKLQKSAKETHEMLKLVYGDAAVTMKMVYKWFERFCNGCETVEGGERSGHPSTTKTQLCWKSKWNDSIKQATDY